MTEGRDGHSRITVDADFSARSADPLHQEIKPNMIELMKLKYTFLQSEIQDGDILCFQAEPSEAE